MARVDTVYLKEKAAPANKDFLSGYVTTLDNGVIVNDREDYRGASVFFPMHVVLRIERDTGWR